MYFLYSLRVHVCNVLQRVIYSSFTVLIPILYPVYFKNRIMSRLLEQINEDFYFLYPKAVGVDIRKTENVG